MDLDIRIYCTILWTVFTSVGLFVSGTGGSYDPYLDEFNPSKVLKSNGQVKHTQQPSWRHSFYGDMTASVAEVTQNKKSEKPECQRVTVFSVRGIVLHGVYEVKKCSTWKDYFFNIIFINDSLWSYPHLKIKFNPVENQVVVVKKEKEAPCKTVYYKLKNEVNVAKAESPEPTNTATQGDCAPLDILTGTFPVSSVTSGDHPIRIHCINLQSNTHLALKFWLYDKPMFHRKMLLHLNGFPMAGVGIFSGTVKDVVVTRTEVHLGNAIMARMSPTDNTEATVLLNPNYGQCIKYLVKSYTPSYLSVNEVRTKLLSKTTLHDLDQECQNLIQGKVIKEKNAEIKAVLKKIEGGTVSLVPVFEMEYNHDDLHGGYFGPRLLDLQPIFVPMILGNGRDMGVLVIVDKSIVFYVLLVVRGTIMDTVLDRAIPNIIIDENRIIVENKILLEKSEDDDNVFSVVSKWDGDFCTRNRYSLTFTEGRYHKQEIFPGEIAVSDKKCELLSIPLENNKYGKTVLDNANSIDISVEVANRDLDDFLT